jgi:quinol monooxygenase YgiN
VLSYTAFADQQEPSQIIILEVYANLAAYHSHLETPHFKKYKESVKGMVQSLELVDMKLVAKASKKDD